MNNGSELKKTDDEDEAYLHDILDRWMERDRKCLQHYFEKIRDLCLENNIALIDDLESTKIRSLYKHDPRFREMCDEDEVVQETLTRVFEERKRRDST